MTKAMSWKSRIKQFLTRYRLDLILIIAIVTLASPIFFYKLGQTSLGSWDEAWYAEIARNILQTGDPLHLVWDNKPFIDHPPMGFWLMASFFQLFGINDLTSRLSSAILGLGSLVITYLLGRDLFSKTVGVVSAMALASATWFVYRARSGNLDVPLTFFFLLTFYLAFQAAKNKRFITPFFISLVCLFLTKTIVPFTILPALVIIFWRQKNLSLQDFKKPALISIGLLVIWVIIQSLYQPVFLSRYTSIGLPGVKIESSYQENLKLIKEYLHNGIGRWFWPGILALGLGPLLLQRRFWVLSVFFGTSFLPFIFSAKGQIWHLVPLHPILILAFFGFAYVLAKKFSRSGLIASLVIILFASYYTFIQVRQNWYQFIDIPAFISDEAILAREASRYPEKLIIDGDFVPAALFYSDKPEVKQISQSELIPLFEEKSFLLIVPQWRLDQAKIPLEQYNILKKDRDRVLIQRR